MLVCRFGHVINVLCAFSQQKKQNSGKGGKKKKVVLKFVLDCTHPVEDGIMDAANFVSRHFSRSHEETNRKKTLISII